MRKRRIYFAKRIPKDSPPQEVLPIVPTMTVAEVAERYAAHEVDCGTYVYNGHWTLRGNTPTSNIPAAVGPHDVWKMCKHKIDSSDAFVACVGLDTYGTIAEAAYAIGRGDKPVYVLPENDSAELLKETWFIFSMSLTTKDHWLSADIENLPLFKERNIATLSEYEDFITSLTPPFLKN